MAGNGAVLLKVVASSVAIARRAGVIIRSILKSGDLAVVDKAGEADGRFDPQTEADRAAQRMIVGSLSQHFPGLKVIGEEEDCDATEDDLLVSTFDNEVLEQKCPDDLAKLKLEDLVVWVDPLDGTAEFTEGHLDHVTVLIGISAEGKAVAGVIHQPFYNFEAGSDAAGRTIWSINGVGTFGIQLQKPVPGRHIVTTTKSHSNRTVLDAVEAMDADKVIRTGGAGYKVLQVIEGDADAYVFASPGCKKWDTCAGESVLRTIGGTLTDILGEEIKYDNLSQVRNLTGVLATSSDHEYYLKRIPASVKNVFQSK